MKIKRILCLCISAVILLSAVGCGSKGAESGNPEQSNKTLAENFGGREVVISGTTLLGGDENSTTYAEEMEFLKELEKNIIVLLSTMFRPTGHLITAQF